VTNVFAVEGVVGDVPAIIVHFLGGLADVWTLNPSGSPVPLFSGVPNPRVSSVGTVLHAIARRGTDFVLVRVRGANAPAETVLPPGDVLSDLFTTYEGAALITSQFSYVVPSQTMVAEPIDLANAIGGVRGAYTVFLARRDASHAPSQPALYAYDEVGGAPRLTTLAPATEGLAYSPIDVPHGPPSKWFVFGLSTCTIAHLATVANTIVLAGSVPCMSPTLTYGYSYTSKGDIVVIEQGGGSRAYLLGPTTGKLVARSTDQLLVFTETGRYDGPRAVALAGTDALGDYICLASNPERCWTLPLGATAISGRWGVNGASDTMTVASITRTASTVTLTVVKAIGTGSRPQPL